jgi:hypothetical protein
MNESKHDPIKDFPFPKHTFAMENGKEIEADPIHTIGFSYISYHGDCIWCADNICHNCLDKNSGIDDYVFYCFECWRYLFCLQRILGYPQVKGVTLNAQFD